MTQSGEPQFEDRALKRAVERAWGAEAAPASLRQKVMGELTAAPVTPRLRWRLELGSRSWKTAAAAVLAVAAIGVAAYQIREAFFPPAVHLAPSYLSAAVASAMIQTHDACARLNDHHLVPGNDLDKLRESLTKDLGFPAAVGSLGEGWKFDGAGLCAVTNVKTAHLLFERKGQKVSIFSIPASALYAATNGTIYSQTVAGHGLSGFVSGNGLYCVVAVTDGKGALSLSDLDEIRNMMSGTVPGHVCGGGGGRDYAH